VAAYSDPESAITCRTVPLLKIGDQFSPPSTLRKIPLVVFAAKSALPSNASECTSPPSGPALINAVRTSAKSMGDQTKLTHFRDPISIPRSQFYIHQGGVACVGARTRTRGLYPWSDSHSLINN